jgi:cysteinyl-tRNA synthetase
MKILLYNTLGGKKEEFKPIKPGHLSFYYCGPTVYWTQHIGNLRGSFCADIVHRTFKYLNYDVSMVRNYTDVGHLSSDADEGQDKMEKTAKKENISPESVADKFIAIYERDTEKLNILEPKFKPRATENINDMIDMIQLLVAKGYAYVTDLAVYFEVEKFKNYSILSGRKIDKNKMGAGRGDVSDPKKKNYCDFALWFFKTGVHENALQFWPSPFVSSLVEKGYGFPGWHIECSAMIKKILGDTIDIHMGGIEHVSIHHSNEIAQSESANGVKLANYWIHNEHLLINNGKMSKSQGSAFSLEDIENKGFSPMALRYFFLQANYRSKQNFTFEALKAAQKGLTIIYNKIKKLGINIGEVNIDFKNKFLDYLLDNFNTPKTLSLISEILKSNLSNEDKLATLLDFDNIWALDFNKIIANDKEDVSLSTDIKRLLTKREEARKNKDFVEADKLRIEIEKLGYKLEDLPNGQSIVTKI